MAKAAEYIVGTLLVRGVVKPEDSERAHAIVAEEPAVWFAIREHNKEWPFQNRPPEDSNPATRG
jgi:hypothetical protein